MKTSVFTNNGRLLGSMSAKERAFGRYMRDNEGHKQTPAEIAALIKSELDTKTAEIKGLAQEASDRVKANEDLSKSFKETVDVLAASVGELKDAQKSLAEQLARGASSDEAIKSVGDMFADGEGFSDFAKNARNGAIFDVQIKAPLLSNGTGAALVGRTVYAPVEKPLGRLYVRDLLPQLRTEEGTIYFAQETLWDNKANVVVEGAAKPESTLEYTPKSIPVQVIAHLIKVSRQMLSDNSAIRGMIDNKLLNGLKLVEENQLLNGSGTGANLFGMVPNATAYVQPASATPETSIDTLRLAMLQVYNADYDPSGHVLNATDLASIELEKDTLGRYIVGDVSRAGVSRLWGLPVVGTSKMAVGKFLTGDFNSAVALFDRWDARVEAGYVNDDFAKNMVTLLAEMREALAILAPAGLVTGSLKPTPVTP